MQNGSRWASRVLQIIEENFDHLPTSLGGEEAEAVQGRAAESAQALMMKPRSLTLDKMREIDNRLAGQRHAADEIARSIRGRRSAS